MINNSLTVLEELFQLMLFSICNSCYWDNFMWWIVDNQIPDVAGSSAAAVWLHWRVELQFRRMREKNCQIPLPAFDWPFWWQLWSPLCRGCREACSGASGPASSAEGIPRRARGSSRCLLWRRTAAKLHKFNSLEVIIRNSEINVQFITIQI